MIEEAADPKMMQKLLLRAAEILEGGWCRGYLCLAKDLSPWSSSQNKDPLYGEVGVDRFCMAGAVMKARSEIYGEIFASREAAQVTGLALQEVQRLLPDVPAARDSTVTKPSIAFFNDRMCVNGRHAADIFRTAAERLA